ncbi:LOW QUALITY PROTEIN: hypothetical protein ACG7TL_007604 [Trametes sanguinea]
MYEEMPSSERKVTWSRVKRHELAKPSSRGASGILGEDAVQSAYTPVKSEPRTSEDLLVNASVGRGERPTGVAHPDPLLFGVRVRGDLAALVLSHDGLFLAILLYGLHAHRNLERASARMDDLAAQAHVAHRVKRREHVQPIVRARNINTRAPSLGHRPCDAHSPIDGRGDHVEARVARERADVRAEHVLVRDAARERVEVLHEEARADPAGRFSSTSGSDANGSRSSQYESCMRRGTSGFCAPGGGARSFASGVSGIARVSDQRPFERTGRTLVRFLRTGRLGGRTSGARGSRAGLRRASDEIFSNLSMVAMSCVSSTAPSSVERCSVVSALRRGAVVAIARARGVIEGAVARGREKNAAALLSSDSIVDIILGTAIAAAARFPFPENLIVRPEGVVVLVSSRAAALVELARDRRHDALHVGELLLEVLRRRSLAVLLNPVRRLLHDVQDRLLVLVLELAAETILVGKLGLQAVYEGRERVERLNALPLSLILRRELLSLLHHTLDLLRRQTALLVRDGDGLRLAGALVDGRDLHDTVRVDLESDLDLRNTTGRGRDTRELKLAEKVVVLRERTLTLVDLDQDGLLVVGSSREAVEAVSTMAKQMARGNLHLALASGDDGVTGDDLGHHTAGGLDTEREGVNIDKDDVTERLVTSEDTTLDGSTVRILEYLLDGLHGLAEEVHVELLELGAGERLGEVVAVLERLDFNARRLLAGERALRLLDFALELAEGTEVARDVSSGLLLVLLDEVVDDTVVEVLTTKVSVTGGSQHLEDTVVDGEQGDIEGTTTKIVDNDLRLAALLVKTVGDGRGGRLVDDTENLKTGDGTGVLGRLTLSVVEVGGDGDNGMGDGATEIGLGSLLHLAQDHGGNLLGSEVAELATVLNLDDRLSTLVDDLEGPVLHVALNLRIIELATDETLSVKDRVLRVGVEGVLRGVTNTT